MCEEMSKWRLHEKIGERVAHPKIWIRIVSQQGSHGHIGDKKLNKCSYLFLS